MLRFARLWLKYQGRYLQRHTLLKLATHHTGGLLNRSLLMSTPQSDAPESGKQSEQTAPRGETSRVGEPSDLSEDQQAEAAPEWMSGILHELLNTEVTAWSSLWTVCAPMHPRLNCGWLTLCIRVGQDSFRHHSAATHESD